MILSNANERVFAWITYRAEPLCKTMIREVRKKDGLRSPPKKAYTNMSEAMNYVLSVRCPESQPIISFIEAIHEEVRSQQEEVIRAFYSRGEYELCPEYKYLEVAEEVVRSKSSRKTQIRPTG